MVPEIGDLIHILKDTHGYPINWVPGMNTVRFYHADNQMKHGDLVHWKKWEPGYTEPISAIGLLLEDPIESILFGSKVYKALWGCNRVKGSWFIAPRIRSTNLH